MDTKKWTRLFELNDQMTQLHAALLLAVSETAALSKEPLDRAANLLYDFAHEMSELTDTLNEQLAEDRASDKRMAEVDAVLRDLKLKTKGVDNGGRFKNRDEESK